MDKNDKNTCRNIYEEIDATYFLEVKLFFKSFLNYCKKHPNEPQNIPTDIKNNIQKFHYKKVYMRKQLLFFIKEWSRRKNRKNLR